MVTKLFSGILVAVLFGCVAPTMGEYEMVRVKLSATDVMSLPEPAREGGLSLEAVLALRRSVREFTEEALTEQEIGQLLWATQGVTDPEGYRTAPSAGALYPLEIYLVTDSGLYHYEPDLHQLRRHNHADLRPVVYDAALDQESILNAPATFVITGVVERTAQKYGDARSPRYVHLEAGHAAQNLLLQAVALDLGAVPIGAFDDAQLQEILALPADHEPLYLIPVGHPR